MFQIVWSDEDGEWVATHSSFPSLSWVDDSPMKALDGLLTVMEDLEI